MNTAHLRNTQKVGRCLRCNGQNILWDVLCGFINCPICDPEGRVCLFCGDDIEEFNGGYHQECREDYDHKGSAIIAPEIIREY